MVRVMDCTDLRPIRPEPAIGGGEIWQQAGSFFSVYMTLYDYDPVAEECRFLALTPPSGTGSMVSTTCSATPQTGSWWLTFFADHGYTKLGQFWELEMAKWDEILARR